MVQVQHFVGSLPISSYDLSVLSYNILLPNSVDGWWHYKMYLPPLTEQNEVWSTWEYRKELLKKRIGTIDADVVCLQEVSPLSFEDDFKFMDDLGYSGREMFKKGRFRPATFWKSDRVELVSPPIHKDRTLLTAFRPLKSKSIDNDERGRIWYILNCHLQAGKEGRRRVRQINEGVRAVMTLARKLKERNPERHIPLIVCGDFNGGPECGAIRYLEDGFVDEQFREDGDPVVSGKKELPLEHPLADVASSVDRTPPNTLVVNELISLMVNGAGYDNPKLSEDVIQRLTRIYGTHASHAEGSGARVMDLDGVKRWLTAINREVGRGSEYREAAREMGWRKGAGDDHIELPLGGMLSLNGFLHVYELELRAGKFWGIAHDLAVLGEPLPDAGVFESRYDRIYCSSSVRPVAVVDFPCSSPCPNGEEPSDHLPVAAAFTIRNTY